MTASAPTYRYANAHIAVFAREPISGEVKTRLIPALGAEGALALYEAMLTRAMALVSQQSLAPSALWVSSNKHHKSFVSVCNKKEIYLQDGATLGDKMWHCAATALSWPGTDSVVIIGTDCPALTTLYLESALQALDSGADVVLGPALDGGYVLIGLRQARHELFAGIDWGTPSVLAQTLAKVAALNLQCKTLEPLWDVDEAEDLQRLATLDPPLLWAGSA